MLLRKEYHSWNSFQKEVACVRCTNKCHMVWCSEGWNGQKGEETFFILYNKLFVGKIYFDEWFCIETLLVLFLLWPWTVKGKFCWGLLFQHCRLYFFSEVGSGRSSRSRSMSCNVLHVSEQIGIGGFAMSSNLSWSNFF